MRWFRLGIQKPGTKQQFTFFSFALEIVADSEGLGEGAVTSGLFLRVRESFASWAFRYTSPTGKRRELWLASQDRDAQAQGTKGLAVWIFNLR